MRILSFTLGETETQAVPGGARLLAAPLLPGMPDHARLYFTPGLTEADLTDGTKARMFSGAAVVTMPLHQGRIALPLRGITATVPPDPAETVFAGRNVLIGLRNGEDAGIVADWLDWHRKIGADAALIVDRAPPGDSALFRAELARRDSKMIVAVVNASVPLGQAGMGPEGHPFHAPDAPGKARMEPPAPDPWAAPLGLATLFQILHDRFLHDARAVASIEIIDLIQPEDASPFDRAANTPGAAIPLTGRRVYPWALDGKPGFADHDHVRFDATSSERRWAIAPRLAPRNALWMPTRVLGAEMQGPPIRFDRHMALRHGDGRIGRIVPKSSLIALDRTARALQPATGPVTIVTTMKNEGPFILEWIAYHRAIGVDRFLVYSNDCTDGTDVLLSRLQDRGIVRHKDNPYRGMDMKPQHAALADANDDDWVRDAGWLICMDVDEYIAVHTGDGRLSDLFAAMPGANMISLTWRLFGNADIHDFDDRPITQQFTLCARENSAKPHQAWGFKTLYRNDGIFRKMGVHRPKGLNPQHLDAIAWVNGSGRAMPPEQYRTAWRSNAGTVGYDLVTLNHYAVRSVDSFLVKRDRGRVNHVDRDQGIAYWFRMNHNVEQDLRMARMQPLIRAGMAELLADPAIARAHAACIDAHRAKIAELKAQPKYAAFRAELIAPRAEKLARLHGHFGSNIYLAGPSVIPDDIVARDPGEDFFFTIDHVPEVQH